MDEATKYSVSGISYSLLGLPVKVPVSEAAMLHEGGIRHLLQLPVPFS